MVIRNYSPCLKSDCLAIFDSNVPQLYRSSEREEFSHWLDFNAKDQFYVLSEKNEIVACGGIYINLSSGSAGLVWGMVGSEHYGKGYAQALTTYRLQQLLEKATCHSMRISASLHTSKFYKKCGLKQVYIKKDGLAPGLDRYDFVIP
jgi:N-acetylglutamate synthase-like GNAT family acetyltransferase